MNTTVQEVGPGCYAWLRLPGSWGQTNIGLVVGGGASLLIDTPWDLRLTRSMLAGFAPHTAGAPISLLLNTHSDPDHWWGNQEVAGAEVIASADCARAMGEEPSPQQLSKLRRVAHAAALMPGRPGAAGRYVDAMLSPLALEEVAPRLPDRTFTDRRSETIGGREVEFIDYGAAHTRSDSVVLVPDARAVFTGDLLFAGVTPVMWHGPLSRWLTALDAIAALDADIFVPGHGPVSTRRQLTALRDYWSWLSAAVETGEAGGQDPLELATRLTRTPEFDAFRGWENPERLYINVATISRQHAGKGALPTDPISRTKAFDAVAALSRHLQRR